MKKALCSSLAVWCMACALIFAQGYTIRTPGQIGSTVVTPTYGGGYRIRTPGQIGSTVVTPR